MWSKPAPSQNAGERIQALRFGPYAQSLDSTSLPASVRSGGIAVYYPPDARQRFRGTPAGTPSSAPGPTVYISNWPDGNVLVFDPGTNRVVDTIPVGATPGGIVISPDARFLYVALETVGSSIGG